MKQQRQKYIQNNGVIWGMRRESDIHYLLTVFILYLKGKPINHEVNTSSYASAVFMKELYKLEFELLNHTPLRLRSETVVLFFRVNWKVRSLKTIYNQYLNQRWKYLCTQLCHWTCKYTSGVTKCKLEVSWRNFITTTLVIQKKWHPSKLYVL